MIKRRFYRQEHADRNGDSDSSLSSSDSELEAEEEATEETDAEDDAVAKVKNADESCSTSSGYESEDSSENEVDFESSGLLTNDNDAGTGNGRKYLPHTRSSGRNSAEMVEILSNNTTKNDLVPADVASCILKCKSVFKCRLCPRIVCLTEETLRAHLKSKRHARSEKLQKEGRLKLMLNCDGELEEELETHAERHDRVMGLVQDNPKAKNKGRQRQRLRKKKTGDDSSKRRSVQLTNTNPKKRHKKRIEGV